jgi:mannosyltransferase OCH1-like enzyme
MIPKKIHYAWFGGKPLPLQARRCIASWDYLLARLRIAALG